MAKTKEKEEEVKGITFFNPTPAKIELMAATGETMIIKASETVTIEEGPLLFEAQRDPRLIKSW